MSRTLRLSALLGATLVLGLSIHGVAIAVESAKALVDRDGVYTLVNLHPDEQRAKLFAVNHQQEGLIPLCTRVRIIELGKKRMKFRVEKTGKEYIYDYHKAAVEAFDVHLARFFGTNCNSKKVAKLSKTDQEGVARGKAMVGMTRQGIIYAMGYPPPHVTPDLDALTWTYWRSRWNKVAVEFDSKGRVANIRE